MYDEKQSQHFMKRFPKPGVSKLFARRATCSEMNIFGGRVSQKNVLTFFRIPRHAPQERKRRSWVATKDIIHNLQLHIYNVYGRNTTLSFSLLWSMPQAGFEESEYIFLRHPACHGPDSLHKFKSSRGPDKILSQAELWTCLPYTSLNITRLYCFHLPYKMLKVYLLWISRVIFNFSNLTVPMRHINLLCNWEDWLTKW